VQGTLVIWRSASVGGCFPEMLVAVCASMHRVLSCAARACWSAVRLAGVAPQRAPYDLTLSRPTRRLVWHWKEKKKKYIYIQDGYYFRFIVLHTA
jgi:hypothetical protein